MALAVSQASGQGIGGHRRTFLTATTQLAAGWQKDAESETRSITNGGGLLAESCYRCNDCQDAQHAQRSRCCTFDFGTLAWDTLHQHLASDPSRTLLQKGPKTPECRSFRKLVNCTTLRASQRLSHGVLLQAPNLPNRQNREPRDSDPPRRP